MNNITDYKYFNYGCSDPMQGLWALYSPVESRILYVSFEHIDLRTISLILSSKINLIKVFISKCSNFKPELIDNSCCTRWDINFNDPTIPSNNQLKIIEIFNHDGLLVEKEYKNLENIQKIIFLTKNVIDFFIDKEHLAHFQFIDVPFRDKLGELILQTRKECFNLLYHCKSTEEIEDIIVEKLENLWK